MILTPARARAAGAPDTVTALQRGTLEDFSEHVEGLVRRVSPSVLQVVSETFAGREDDARGAANTVARQTGIGTGFLASADGDVITNAHVIAGARRVRVRIHDTNASSKDYTALGRLVDAQVV